MTVSKKRLVVMSVGRRLPAGLLTGLRRVCDVVPCRPESDLKDLLQSGPWHGAVISADRQVATVLTAARNVKRANPAGAVILMASLPAGESSREAFDAGVDVIVDPGDYDDLYAAVVTRMSPSLSDARGGPAWAPSPGAPGAALMRPA